MPHIGTRHRKTVQNALIPCPCCVHTTSYDVDRERTGQLTYLLSFEYSKTRKAFGKLIAGHQLVQRNLSDMATAIEASRLLCYSALARIDRGESAEGDSAMAKRFAQNSCEQVVCDAINTLGALGLSREAGLERLYRDARMLAMPDGTNEILALIHGRALTGVAAFRD